MSPQTQYMGRPQRRHSPVLRFILRFFLALLGLAVGIGLYIWNLLGRPAFTAVQVVDKFLPPDRPVSQEPLEPVGTNEQGEPVLSTARVRVWAPPEYPIERVAPIDANVTNILVFGVDARSPEERSARTDAMMVLSLDKRNDKIKITSLMRDLEVSIPGYEGQATKLNAAYAYGGVGLLINTINRNFKLDIQDFMMLDFWSAAGLVDQVGGIGVPVTAEELPYLNASVREYNRLTGRAAEQDVLAEAGNQTLNGAQAIAWARIRRIGSDHARTGRQRYVVSAMLEVFGRMNVMDKVATATEALGHVETNVTRAGLLKLGLGNLDTLGSTDQYKVPADGMYRTNEQNWNMILDWDRQLPALHGFIFGN